MHLSARLNSSSVHTTLTTEDAAADDEGDRRVGREVVGKGHVKCNWMLMRFMT